MEKIFLSIDIGTTGCKAILFNKEGQLLKKTYREYQSIYLSARWIDHDPSTWLQAAQKTVMEIISTGEYPQEQLAAISITSQRATFISVDKNGQALENAILWQDKRAITESNEIIEKFGQDDIYDRTGLRVDPYFTLPKLIWLKKNKPEIYQKTYCFLMVQDFIIYHLTGKFATDWTQASRTMFFNIENFSWDETIIEKFDIDYHKIPPALKPGTIVGKTNKLAKKHFGLIEGIPVIVAGGDQQCAAVGLGVVEEGLIEVNTGSGSFVLANSSRFVKDKKKRILCSASAIPGSWVLEAGIFTTGGIYRWFRNNFGKEELKIEQQTGQDAYQILDLEAEKEPPGANGLLLIPHFAASAAPYWNPEARGVLFGLTLSHSKASVARAILEGISFEVQKNILLIEKNTAEINEVRISGGASNSNIFNQIQADIYGKEVVKTICNEASSLGAAILASVAVNTYPDLNFAVKKMVKIDQESRKKPNINNTKKYQELFELHNAIYYH
ncbi:MAG: FGGY family carbohydrate kinase, partial [Atribacterota bacterium]|nr:FGGY family carbohydrate kinase [Atribacterota bacterium]